MQTNIYAEESCIHVCAHTHTIRDKSHMCTNSVIYRTTECTQKVTHVPTQSYLYIQVAHTPTYTHTHRHGSEATGPSLPVACTMHSSGVRGCTFGRRELAGRTLAGTDWDPSTLWPPVGMSSWRPTHFHLCSGPAGKQGPLTKPPWSVIGYKGGHVGPQEGPPNSWSSKLSLWLFLSKLYPDSLSAPIVSLPPVDPAVSSKWQERASPRLG